MGKVNPLWLERRNEARGLVKKQKAAAKKKPAAKKPKAEK